MLNKDFYPLAYSSSNEFKGQAILIGHGIAAPGRDDYSEKKDLKGKVFVIESGYPTDIDLHSKLGNKHNC